jgi:hypothetical protein
MEMGKRARLGVLAMQVFALASSAGAASEWDPERILRMVQEVKQSDTREWQKIPWTASLLEARQLSQKENRPVFLFTHDGNIDTGRC